MHIKLPNLLNIVLKKNSNSSCLIYPNGCYDIIGDIHGYCDELIALFKKMGYKNIDGLWQHKTRKAVFVGDFISRGPDSKGVLEIIRSMVESGKGYAVLGNHELNAIGYFTYKKSGKPIYLPPTSNRNQLDKVKKQYKNEKEFSDTIKWLRTLPFFLKLGSIRVVHAYWNQQHVSIIRKNITNGKLTKKLIKDIVNRESIFALAVHQTTRGIELNLPDDLIIKDSKNTRRSNFRIKWWKNPFGKTFEELSFGNRFKLPEYTIPSQILFPYKVYNKKQPIVFFGHYCIKNEPLVIAPNICCIDRCIAGSGYLTAYRYNGEKELLESNFVFKKKIEKD